MQRSDLPPLAYTVDDRGVCHLLVNGCGIPLAHTELVRGQYGEQLIVALTARHTLDRDGREIVPRVPWETLREIVMVEAAEGAARKEA